MKHLTLIAIATLLLFGCRKPTYTIKVEKNTLQECLLDVNGKQYNFTETPYTVEITAAKRDAINVSVKYTTYNSDLIRLSISHSGGEIGSVHNSGYLWIIYSDGYAKTSGNSYSSSNSGGGSSSSSSYCGAPTKDGTPCKRKVSGGGYCWQHK